MDTNALRKGVESLGIHGRLRNTLRWNGILMLGQLACLTPRDLLMMRGVGKGSLREVPKILKANGIEPDREVWGKYL